MIVGFLVNGAILGAVLVVIAFLLSRFTRDIVGRALLVVALLIAALAYVLFATWAGERPSWVVGELVGVGIYGTMAVLGLRRSPWWLAAGWAAHPIWDVVLHYLGSGSSVAPEGWVIACVSFDLLVASYIAIASGRGLVRQRGLALRHGAQ